MVECGDDCCVHPYIFIHTCARKGARLGVVCVYIIHHAGTSSSLFGNMGGWQWLVAGGGWCTPRGCTCNARLDED